MFEKDGSAGTLRPIIIAKCGFGGARPPGEPPSMTQPCLSCYPVKTLFRFLFG